MNKEIYTDTNWDDILEYNHMKWINYDRFKEVQKKAELGEHYKHLYSEVKKQKDDVIKVLYQLIRMLGEIE